MATAHEPRTMTVPNQTTHPKPEHTCPTCGASYFSKDVADECNADHFVSGY